jgi:tRNA-Thr(GGU) m(6)t(6)A37 methyltransferase TsaA
MAKTFPVKVIGRARSPITKQKNGGFRTVLSEIYLDPEYVPGILGIEAYSHLQILFWMDRSEPRYKLKVVPQSRPELPEVGIFASRECERPNPIGLSVCELIRCDGERITVRGLDVVDGTPIVDIKPYAPMYDWVESPRYPDWLDKLEY